jgi:hypothetical protein
MTELLNLVAAARADFDKHRVNKAMESVIKALEIIAGQTTSTTGKPVLTEPAPAPTAPPVVEDAPRVEPTATTPADLAAEQAGDQVLDEQTPKAKRAPRGSRATDMASAPGSIVVS